MFSFDLIGVCYLLRSGSAYIQLFICNVKGNKQGGHLTGKTKVLPAETGKKSHPPTTAKSLEKVLKKSGSQPETVTGVNSSSSLVSPQPTFQITFPDHRPVSAASTTSLLLQFLKLIYSFYIFILLFNIFLLC